MRRLRRAMDDRAWWKTRQGRKEGFGRQVRYGNICVEDWSISVRQDKWLNRKRKKINGKL